MLSPGEDTVKFLLCDILACPAIETLRSFSEFFGAEEPWFFFLIELAVFDAGPDVRVEWLCCGTNPVARVVSLYFLLIGVCVPVFFSVDDILPSPSLRIDSLKALEWAWLRRVFAYVRSSLLRKALFFFLLKFVLVKDFLKFEFFFEPALDSLLDFRSCCWVHSLVGEVAC